MTEVALLQCTSNVVLLKPAELYIKDKMVAEHLAVIEQTHIYLVCQRPRIRLIDSIRTDDGITLTLESSSQDGAVKKILFFPNNEIPVSISKIKVEGNGSYFIFQRPNGDESATFPIELLLKIMPYSLPELSELEVVYIGQALGDSAQRSALDRLVAHSTLQRVLAEQAQGNWWMETVLLLFTYAPHRLIAKTDGRGTPEVTEEDGTSHFSTIYDSPLSISQLVTIAEASLIRYFQPKYNVHFKGEYPTSNMKHLKDAYRLDYNAIITEIDTEDILINVRSALIPPSDHHIAQFDLHNPNDRLSFFELSDKIDLTDSI